ncbi:MAG: MarR family winged helix-turn-helix transcriptional regulator [Pigmentiphaga sp.]|uniref:MarR family winged helix-turn-helix transcriptional regulator n=1 Tax=Pigmentiphaga sp. TaxID=1977564 RepID=UPI0029AE1C6D|nr:MarR family winged helix-turn-helix transcriptional regulator [Pigmentiphaga sp.]MDX3904887.1 MarR family winged helix-turn-helix transcriptional regulator [Pigmentiphaga sp.]
MPRQPRPRPDAQAGDAYRFNEQVGHLLRRAYQRHTAIFQQVIPDSQLTVVQFVVLCAVRDAGSCSLSDVVKATAIDQATVRGVIKRLVARRLLSLGHDSHDRRRVLLSLTAGGKALVGEMVPFAQDITEATFAGLNPAERVAIVFLLRKMAGEDLA